LNIAQDLTLIYTKYKKSHRWNKNDTLP